MSLFRKYYEELYINISDDRELLPVNQNIITELLRSNKAVGVFGMYDEPGFPIYFCSGFALDSVGYSFDELISVSGGDFLNLIYEKDRDEFLERAGKTTLDAHDFRVVHASGKSIWVEFHCKRSRSFDDRPIIIASLRVIDDSKKRESELLDALTKRFRTIAYVDVNAGRYRIIKSGALLLTEGHEIGTIKELRGLLSRYCREYISPEDYSLAQVLEELDFSVDSDGNGGNYQATFQAKLGDRYQWTQFQTFYGGTMNLDTGHFILTFSDVDEEKKKELEANRILSDSLTKAAEASRVKNQFITRMSHDLRTPINGIVRHAGDRGEEPR